ncbi:MAG TPA: STY0301 family protein [Stellaceae bacterium]|nr:STY0301 family protein [Stellaceae bacterium]
MATPAAVLLLLAAAAAPPVALECPVIAGQTLVYIDIYDGPPENQADLAPDEHSRPGGKTVWNTWQLMAGADGLFVKCGYGKSLGGPYSRTEIIRLPDTVESCRADFKTGPKPSDLTLVHFSCR